MLERENQGVFIVTMSASVFVRSTGESVCSTTW
jgi:hypothetical protein